MSIQNNEQVPCWVRSFICIVSISSVLALVVAAYNGADISIGLSAMVGAVAIHASTNAFHGRM